MVCRPLEIEGSVTGFVCGPGRRCVRCGGRAEKLCDFPVTRKEKAVSCDRSVCRVCATSIGADLDLCPSHAEYWNREERCPKIGPLAGFVYALNESTEGAIARSRRIREESERR